MVVCKELIITDIARRGSGKDQTSPVRSVRQVFDKDGTLLAEYDHCGSFSIEQLFDFARHCRNMDNATIEDAYQKWKPNSIT